MAPTIFQRRGPFAAALIALLLVAALLRPWPARFRFRDGGDCVRYRDWSHLLRDQGVAAWPALVAEYRARWLGFPPPTRFAYLYPAALVERAWRGATDEYHPLVLLSWLPGILALLPLALWLRRRGEPEAGLLAALLLATAPVERALSHFPLPDALMVLWNLSLLAAAAARLPSLRPEGDASRREPRLVDPRRWHLALVALFAMLLVATRETGLIGVIGVFALAALERRRRGVWDRGLLLALLGGLALATAITLPLAGGPRALALLVADVARGSLKLTGNMGYVSGPYWRYFSDLAIVSPALVATVLVAAVPLAQRPATRPLAAEVAVSAVAPLALYAILPKTLRYVMPVDAALRALAALAIWSLWRSGRKRLAPILLAVLIAHDIAAYLPLWGSDQYYDPVTWVLTRGLHMIP